MCIHIIKVGEGKPCLFHSSLENAVLSVLDPLSLANEFWKSLIPCLVVLKTILDALLTSDSLSQLQLVMRV